MRVGKRGVEQGELLILRPHQVAEFEKDGEESVVLLVPRFRSEWARRWILPRLKRPNIRVRLDATGSFVWNLCDGQSSVQDIATRASSRFGGDPADWQDRVLRFLGMLARDRFVLLEPLGGERARRPQGASPGGRLEKTE